MNDCPAEQQLGPYEGFLHCDLWKDHRPPIHWDKQVGIHWFRMEEQPGYEPGSALVYEQPAER